jgi:hypothetical protein
VDCAAASLGAEYESLAVCSILVSLPEAPIDLGWVRALVQAHCQLSSEEKHLLARRYPSVAAEHLMELWQTDPSEERLIQARRIHSSLVVGYLTANR